MPHLFYTSRVEENMTIFEDAEFHHMKVVRIKEGNVVYATDGKGNIYRVKVARFEKNKAMGEIMEVETAGRPYITELTVAVALFKWKRMRLMLEKAVELGVDELRIFRSEHSSIPFEPGRTEKFWRVLIEAAKQSFNPWLPRMRFYPCLDEALEDLDGELFVAHRKGKCVFDLLRGRDRTQTSLALVVGPEGDFSKREMELLKSMGEFVNLGPYILRSETAFVVGVTIMNLIRQMART